MRVTSKGQVTIPQGLREAANIPPGSEVEFQMEGERLYLARKAGTHASDAAIARMSGRATVRMSTEEILALTRGDS